MDRPVPKMTLSGFWRFSIWLIASLLFFLGWWAYALHLLRPLELRVPLIPPTAWVFGPPLIFNVVAARIVLLLDDQVEILARFGMWLAILSLPFLCLAGVVVACFAAGHRYCVP